MPGMFCLPEGHDPVLRVPKGGSSCANCRFYVPQQGTFGHCAEPNYQRWTGTTAIPVPPDEMCSDWYEPRRRLPMIRF